MEVRKFKMDEHKLVNMQINIFFIPLLCTITFDERGYYTHVTYKLLDILIGFIVYNSERCASHNK